MAKCHECDSEVAEIDVFCPFCGISLDPISLGGAESVDPFEKTVVMPLPKKSSEDIKTPSITKKSKSKIEVPEISPQVDPSEAATLMSAEYPVIGEGSPPAAKTETPAEPALSTEPVKSVEPEIPEILRRKDTVDIKPRVGIETVPFEEMRLTIDSKPSGGGTEDSLELANASATPEKAVDVQAVGSENELAGKEIEPAMSVSAADQLQSSDAEEKSSHSGSDAEADNLPASDPEKLDALLKAHAGFLDAETLNDHSTSTTSNQQSGIATEVIPESAKVDSSAESSSGGESDLSMEPASTNFDAIIDPEPAADLLEPEKVDVPVEEAVSAVAEFTDDPTLKPEYKDFFNEIPADDVISDTGVGATDSDSVSDVSDVSETPGIVFAEIEIAAPADEMAVGSDIQAEPDEEIPDDDLSAVAVESGWSDAAPAEPEISGLAGLVPEETFAAKADSDENAIPTFLPDVGVGSETPHLEAAAEPKIITNDFEKEPSRVDAAPVAVQDSGTAPNMGTGDTDGKKSGLKALPEGTILNARYEISKKIGGGGMGAVYLAFDKNLGGVERAVKEMVQSHIEEDQQQKAIEDFKRESMILSTLDHPSIPTIYDYFYAEAESRFYLVMKYISGGDLAGRLRAAPGGRIDERTVSEWALQIIDVLAYLHGLPTTIVYRDLKPSNVMIDGNSGRIMLIDFGIARSINQAQEKGVTAVGTMGYAPPELFSGNVEPRSDIYSLGSTMFHLLTGADPQNNPLLIFDFQKNPRPRQINPQLSDQMERILMRSVEYNAAARFTTAAEMRQVLGDHLENLKRGSITFGVTEIPDAVSLANQSVFCGFCGQRIVATDLFCAFCGAKQPIAQQGVHSEIYSRTAPTAKLVIDGTGDLDTPIFSLEKNDNLVGRRDPMSNIFPEVDLSKYDPQTKISRRHARIWSDGGKFLVEDLGSSNGTILLPGISDSFRLTPHLPHPLANGDRIRIGDTTLHFLVG